MFRITYKIMEELFQEYKDKGLTGLANVGNTCYLNSCMQILSHTYELNEFLLKNTIYFHHQLNELKITF